MMEVRINDTRIEHTQGCNTVVVHTVTNASLNNVGWYQCVAQLHNSSFIRIPAGELHVVGKSRTHAVEFLKAIL